MDREDIDNEFEKAWNEEPASQPLDKKQAAWNEFSAQAFPARKRRQKPWKYIAAAVFIISVSVGGWLLSRDAMSNDAVLAGVIIENPTQKIKQVVLPDSSVVDLAPDARIEYNDGFATDRKISIDGEAFFSVKKDKKHPFRVSCGATTTTVLGTSFTVAGDEGRKVSVKLYEGSVRMNVKNNPDSWILSPGEEFIYDNNAVKVLAFDRFIDFDNTAFAEVVKYVTKTYGYRMVIPEKYLKERITLRLNKKEELSDIISIISQMYNLTPEINEELKQITFQ